MFTGLIEEGGRVAGIHPGEQGARLEVEARVVLDGLELGDSVAVNGTCLTAVAIGPDGFAVDCVAETLRRTSLGGLAVGDRVNLERPMRLGDRLDGHLVQGHVDGVGHGPRRDARGREHAARDLRARRAAALRRGEGEHLRGRRQPDRGGPSGRTRSPSR